MSAIIYTDIGFGGESHVVDPGNYDRQYLRDIYHGNFETNISSIKVHRNTLVMLSTSSSPVGSGNNRVIIGPQEISDLSTILFNDKTNSFKVRRFREDNWGASASASVFSNYNFSGKFKNLRAGDYSASRLAAREDDVSGLADGEVKSLTVGSNSLLILYDGPNFETDQNSVYIEGPAQVGDLSQFSFTDKVSSIRLFSVDDPPTLRNNPHYGPPSPQPDLTIGNTLPRIERSKQYARNPLARLRSSPPAQNNKISNDMNSRNIVAAKIHDPPNYSLLVLLFVIILLTAILTSLGFYVISHTRQSSIVQSL